MGMKLKLYCASLFLLPILASGVKTDGIKQISKPYLGTYRAEQVLWGSNNMLPFLRDLKIELTNENSVVVTYKQGFWTQSFSIPYKIDENGELWVKESAEITTWQKVTTEKGKLIVTLPLAGKTLHAVFCR